MLKQTELPWGKDISVNKLYQTFSSKSATYKHFWFISIIQLFIKNQEQDRIEIRSILIHMIANAWYPINYFKLNFGYSDNLEKHIKEIQQKLDIPVDISADKLVSTLEKNTNNKIEKLISHFGQHVPYRFLSPWIKHESNTNTLKQSSTYTNNCIYRLTKGEHLTLEINPFWKDYLFKNNKILLEFTYWKLANFVQSKNLNTPNVINKLIKPIERGNLTKQRKFWDTFIDSVDDFSCIYTGKSLVKNAYDVEHFIPWSFVTHDQLWNLLPADSSINSSKGNKLPSLDKYLLPFAEVQREAIKVVYKNNPKNKLLEDYFFIEGSIPKILDLSENNLVQKFRKTMEPLIQIANNSGFDFWEEKSI